MTDVTKFPKNKRYKDFGPLLADVAKEKSHIKSGIIVLFDEDGEINVLPCCELQQCSYAAAKLLQIAAE